MRIYEESLACKRTHINKIPPGICVLTHAPGRVTKECPNNNAKPVNGKQFCPGPAYRLLLPFYSRGLRAAHPIANIPTQRTLSRCLCLHYAFTSSRSGRDGTDVANSARRRRRFFVASSRNFNAQRRGRQEKIRYATQPS